MKDAREIEMAAMAMAAEDDVTVVFKLIRGRWIEQAPANADTEEPVRIRFDGIPLPGGRRLI